jgi:phage baseplate assembly protein W
MKSLVRKNLFSDLDLDFTPHPVTGDISRKVDAEAVKRSVRNLVLMNKYDKPFKPQIDSRVTRLLFEPATPLTALAIRSNIIDILTRYEPRASINDVVVLFDPDYNAFSVSVSFLIMNSRDVSTVNVSIERFA